MTGLTLVRILRLLRLLRIAKLNKNSVTIMVRTMRASSASLQILLIVLVASNIFMSAIVYMAERGDYNDQLQYWERTTSYLCPITIYRNTPVDSAYVSSGSHWDLAESICTLLTASNVPLTSGPYMGQYEAVLECSYP